MTHLESSILKYSDHDENCNLQEEFDIILRSILITRAKEGATLAEIKDDYYDLIGEPFPLESNPTDYLLSIPFVTCNVNTNGTRIFNLAFGGKSNHLLGMVQQQKPNTRNMKRNNRMNNYRKLNNYEQYHNNIITYNRDKLRKIDDYQNNENNYSIYPHYMKYYERDLNDNNNSIADSYRSKQFYEDNCNYMKRKFIGSTETLSSINTNIKNSNTSSCFSIATKTMYSNENNPKFNDEPYLGKYQLIGDDFFLHLAKTELGVRIRKGFKNVLYSGLCISGQTISAATHNINTSNKLNKKLILNIGSVDILQGHFLIDIKDDFHELVKTIVLKGITPILTTLPPIANLNHRPEIKKKLENFNEFIRTSGFPFIDIWKAMVDEKGSTLFDCYQSEARYVTGSCHPHLLWNKIGRQRIYKYLKNNLL